MQQSRTPATVLAFFFLVLMLGALGVRFWAGDRVYDFTGPTHIAAGGDDVYLHAAGDVYRLTAAGDLVGVISPDRTGLTDVPIDLGVLDDGSLLIAGQEPAFIKICQVEPWQCHTLGLPVAALVERQFKVVYSPDKDAWILSDAHGDTLWRFANDEEPQKLVPDRTLAGPNGLAFGAAGKLWVADTDHRRIVEFTPQDDGSFLAGREHSAKNALTVGDRHFPMMLARARDDRWWVIQAQEFSDAHANVVIYEENEGAQAVIDLPEGAYPTDITALERAMLVTDMERLAVYSVDSESLVAREFGDENFRRSLLRIGESRKKFERLGTTSFGALVLFAAAMIFAAIQATPKHKRWTEPPGLLDVENAPDHVPDTKGVHWLERDPGWERTLKWVGPVFYIPFVVGIVSAVVFYGWLVSQTGPVPDAEWKARVGQTGLMFLLSGLGLVCFIPLVHLQLRNLRQKLGTDGKRLYIRLKDGRELSVEPSRLCYTNQAILYQRHTFPLQGARRKSVYIPGEAETWLAPLLRQARKLSATQALKYRWNNGDDVLYWTIAVGFVMALIIILIEFISP